MFGELNLVRIRGVLQISRSKIVIFACVHEELLVAYFEDDYPDLTRYTLLHGTGLQMGQVSRRTDALCLYGLYNTM